MKNARKAFALILAAAVLPGPSWAAYEDLGVSARGAALGGAVTAVADDAYAAYYNPAGLGTLSRPELVTSYSKLLAGLSDGSNLQNSFLAYAHPLDRGPKGVAALAWNYMTLDSLYKESSLFLSYGRGAPWAGLEDRLFLGGSLKYLNRSLGSTSATDHPLGPTGAVVPGASDPVLQRSSKGNMDLDLGALYRLDPHWTAGVAFQHFLEPNVAFSPDDADTLGRNVKLGAAYKTPFSVVSMDLDFNHAPDGSIDKIAALGAEKWLPTLLHGSFGVRGSLSAGSRSYRQLGAGLSYKFRQLQFDYGFAIPLGGLTQISGTHRLGLTLRFGRAKAPEATVGEAVLENLPDLAPVGSPEFRYQAAELEQFKRASLEELLQKARTDVGAGRFADAAEKLSQAASLKPGDAQLTGNLDRVRAVAEVYPDMLGFTFDPVKASAYEAALSFVSGKDREALRKAAYAKSLAPADAKVDSLIKAIESKSGVFLQSLPAASPVDERAKVVEGAMALIEIALRQREYDKVLKLADEAIVIDPANSLARRHKAAAYYGMRDYPAAVGAMREAFDLEKDPQAKAQLGSYVQALAALVERRKVRPAPVAAEPKLKATPQQIERLYEEGVDLYAQGRLSESAAAFKRILDLEPSNVSARRALERVQADIMASGKK